jgi:PKD repeat protein
LVHFRGAAEQRPGTGTIVWANWDFEGDGEVSFEHDIDGNAARVELDAHHTYQEPGTYFASLRVGAHRAGSDGIGAAAENVALVRVRVSE